MRIRSGVEGQQDGGGARARQGGWRQSGWVGPQSSWREGHSRSCIYGAELTLRIEMASVAEHEAATQHGDRAGRTCEKGSSEVNMDPAPWWR